MWQISPKKNTYLSVQMPTWILYLKEGYSSEDNLSLFLSLFSSLNFVKNPHIDDGVKSQ